MSKRKPVRLEPPRLMTWEQDPKEREMLLTMFLENAVKNGTDVVTDNGDGTYTHIWQAKGDNNGNRNS